MMGAGPAPVIPARTSLRHKDYRRRRSLPPPSSGTAHRQSVNRVNVQPASPEVISSLISSLSAISSPAKNHFDSLPNIGSSRSTPSSPNHYRTNFSRTNRQSDLVDAQDPLPLTGGGFGMDYGAYNHPNDSRENYFLHPDDAAIPPVVRTSKPPSGLSPLTAPLKSPSLKNRMRPTSIGSQSKGSRENDDAISIGNLSIEPGVAPTRSSASINSAGSGGRKAGTIHKGLFYMGSKERLREKEKERGRNRVELELGEKVEGLGIKGGGGENLESPATTSESPLGDTVCEALATAETPRSDAPKSSPGAGPDLHGSSPLIDTRNGSPGGIGSGRFIPTRDSSLRQRQKEISSHGKHRSHRTSDDISRAVQGLEAEHEQPAKVSDNTEEDDVARRIRELKAQKKSREYQPALLTPDSPSKAGSPVANPISLPPLPPNGPPQTASVLASTHILRTTNIQEVQLLVDEASAPSPATVQSKIRNSASHLSPMDGTPTKKQPPSTKTSVDLQGSPRAPLQRSNSRYKRFSRPVSPEGTEKHKRAFSNPLTPQGRGPQLVEDRPSSADSIDNAVNEYLSSPRLSRKIRNPQTGRVISFSEVGDPSGFAVFCCVGMGLTRYITAFYDELALTLRLRLITPDRPGVGESEPYADDTGTPLGWPDDVYAICQALKITKFSILAHSAGAIYALATALRMPQHIRGRVHLLAPWIPPSQMSLLGSTQESLPAGAVPYSQRILRSLPTPFLKAANSSFLSATSASITSSLPKSPRRAKRKSVGATGRETSAPGGRETAGPTALSRRNSLSSTRFPHSNADPSLVETAAKTAVRKPEDAVLTAPASTFAEKERQTTYDTRLTHAIWDLATTNANPAVDLLVCLERRQTIGFRYVDITRAVVIHHGSRDTRVPVENIKWLGKTMRRCEVRILEGEGHGLMASAGVMGGVLMEVAKEWEDWMRVVQGKRGNERRTNAA
ncbi:MAG: hypothetical protein M1830_003042 [Pleopsidium flavum]|nr:MAG: hypothetical protein M1830_003042 [Pleopsidium flavum]